MVGSAAVYGSAQAARALSLPEQLKAPVPGREALLENYRQRNALLDYLFYDIRTVSVEEARTIAPHWAAEGAILLVPPTGGRLTLCKSVDQFFAAGGADVDILAVAGVGSSALGSAAFARNLADAAGRPAAAVVSGYGLADLVTEALGGFFWFGELNRLRHMFEDMDRATRPEIVERLGSKQTESLLMRSSLDTQTVLALLRDPRFSFTILSGHSKGNLVISEALFELRRLDPQRTEALAAAVKIVTVSALIAMPRQFGNVVDIMGAWDWFGGLNSRLDIPVDHKVPRAWHHTNTELPAHLPVTATFREALKG
jgi:hypothetical protein